MDRGNYFIKPGYRVNPAPGVYADSEADALTYQLEVYRFAADYAQRHRLSSVLDVGCGLALKLREFFHPWCPTIVGVDGRHAIDYCRSNHGFGAWHEADIESAAVDLGRTFDLVVSADVIEHLVDPDRLLSLIRRHVHDRSVVVLSTPERDLRRGPESMGPPENPAHVREWNAGEFLAYLSDRGFEVIGHEIMDLRAGMKTCQTVLCRVGGGVRT